MVRQAHHERNQQVTVHPEPVEGFVQSILSALSVYRSVHHQETPGHHRQFAALQAERPDLIVMAVTSQ